MQTTLNATAMPLPKTDKYRLPPITPLALIIEILVVLAVAWAATGLFHNSDPTQKLPGSEAEWLTSSAYLASMNLHKEGYLPMWEPWLAFGEPLIDNPFSFVLSPITAGPSLIIGGVNGIKVSVVLSAIVAGLGGWVLGRILGLGSVGRVLLGALMVGKGNMLAMIGTGYYQLGVAQAYFPWVIGGTIAILRFTKRRWPIILTAVSFVLLWWAGNIWYTLPMLIMMGLLTLTHVFHVEHRIEIKAEAGDNSSEPPVVVEEVKSTAPRPVITVDRLLLRRMALALFFIAGLSMITFLPIWTNQGRIGGHPNDTIGGTVADLGKVIYQYVDGDKGVYDRNEAPGGAQFYYSFITPLWFLVLIFVILPPIAALHKPYIPQSWRIWLVLAFMTVFATIWGAGGNPIFIWLYQHLPLLGQWRFVGRALAVSSFSIGVLVAMRVDGLWRALVTTDKPFYRRLIPRTSILGQVFPVIAAIILVIMPAFAAYQVIQEWFTFTGLDPTYTPDDVCISWLRRQHPNDQLAVWALNYQAVTTYLVNNVRLTHISADFHLIPDPSTIYNGDLTQSLPEYGLAWEDPTRQFFQENGYINIPESPHPVDNFHCLYHKTDAFPYAYSIPQPILQGFYNDKLPMQAVTKITSYQRHLDRIGLIVDGDPNLPLVVTLQELSYPGWQVLVDNQGAKVESVGGQIGVILPAGAGQHQIYFYFRPPLLMVGGVITLITWALCVLYLLRADRLIPPAMRQRATAASAKIGPLAAKAYGFLLNPDVFEPEPEPPDISPDKALPPPKADTPLALSSGQPPDVPPNQPLYIAVDQVVNDGPPAEPSTPEEFGNEDEVMG